MNTIRSISLEFDLWVQYGPNEVQLIPNELGDTQLEGSQVRIACLADCHPNCSYTWIEQATGKLASSSEILDFKPLKRSDAGSYTCTAQNTIGKSTRVVTLNVTYGPDLVRLIPDKNAYTLPKGSVVNITCQADCNPPCLYSWTQKGDNMTTSLSNTPRLYLPALKYSDEDIYFCTAANEVRNATTVVVVAVKYTPDKPERFEFVGIMNQNPVFCWHMKSDPSVNDMAIEVQLKRPDGSLTNTYPVKTDGVFEYLQRSCVGVSTHFQFGSYIARLVVANEGHYTYSDDHAFELSEEKQVTSESSDSRVLIIVGYVAAGIVLVTVASVTMVVLVKKCKRGNADRMDEMLIIDDNRVDVDAPPLEPQSQPQALRMNRIDIAIPRPGARRDCDTCALTIPSRPGRDNGATMGVQRYTARPVPPIPYPATVPVTNRNHG